MHILLIFLLWLPFNIKCFNIYVQETCMVLLQYHASTSITLQAFIKMQQKS